MRAPSLLALTAASLFMTAPALAASPAPIGAPAATKLSLNQVGRAGAPIKRGSKLDGGNNGLWVIGAAGLVAGVAYAFIRQHDQDKDDNPASP